MRATFEITTHINDLKGRDVCYLVLGKKSRTYIGYTVDPPRRIRQHNGIIVGGAKKTSKGRPWKFIAIVSGFSNRTDALSFEWWWQHPKGRKRSGISWSIEGRLKQLKKLLTGRFLHLGLRVHRDITIINHDIGLKTDIKWYLSQPIIECEHEGPERVKGKTN